jgi:hypothetical protein
MMRLDELLVNIKIKQIRRMKERLEERDLQLPAEVFKELKKLERDRKRRNERIS